MATYGVTAAGYVVTPLSVRIANMQAAYLAAIDPQLDLSPDTPDGQIIGIICAQDAALDELAQVAWNGFNRADVEGQGLDNLGALNDTERAGASYTQVYCLLTFSAPGVFAPSTWANGALTSGTLVASVAGSPSQAFANIFEVEPVNLSGTVSVVNGSATITFSTPQTLGAGQVVVFGSQTSISYTLSAAIIASTTAVLTSQYSGTTNAATTCLPAVVVLMQSTTIGPTPTVNDNTVTQITQPASGWLAVNNPSLGLAPNSSQSQAGEESELDQAYMMRQFAEIANVGTCGAAATQAALTQLLASQEPPIPGIVTVLENTTNAPQVINGLTLPAHTYAPVIYANGSTWPLSTGEALIAETIYNNKPAGITSFGQTSYVVTDPVLGPQTIGFTVPSGQPLYISVVVVPRPGYVLSQLALAIQGALVAAAVAPTPGSGPNAGVPPPGQLAPGATVVGSQLAAVIMSVPGVFDIKTQLVGVVSVQLLTFGFSPSPTNAQPLSVPAGSIATISPATASTNIVVGFGAYP